jgi:hypothetical protein
VDASVPAVDSLVPSVEALVLAEVDVVLVFVVDALAVFVSLLFDEVSPLSSVLSSVLMMHAVVATSASIDSRESVFDMGLLSEERGQPSRVRFDAARHRPFTPSKAPVLQVSMPTSASASSVAL